jgi:hypothetical protein
MEVDCVPFSKNAYDRTEKVYKKLLKEAIIKINGNYDLRIKELLIKSDIQKRDFTKRQLNILSLILTFSYNYGKETAILKPTDFALTGIPSKKIIGEINKLLELNVISWDKDFNEFSIVEGRFWGNDVPFHDHFDEKRSIELFLLNLRHAGIDVTEIIEELNKLEDH